MTIFMFLAGAAERHVVQNRNVVLDHRGLAAHKASRVIEENAAADPRIRIDVALEYGGRAALQIISEVAPAFAPQPMRQAMRLEGVEAFVIEHRLEETVRGRIAIDRR